MYIRPNSEPIYSSIFYAANISVHDTTSSAQVEEG